MVDNNREVEAKNRIQPFYSTGCLLLPPYDVLLSIGAIVGRACQIRDASWSQ